MMREIRELAEQRMRELLFHAQSVSGTVPRVFSESELTEVLTAFAESIVEQCCKVIEDSVDSLHTAHHSRDYCDGFLQGRKNLRETLVSALRNGAEPPPCDCSAGKNARLYEHHRDCHWLQYVSAQPTPKEPK